MPIMPVIAIYTVGCVAGCIFGATIGYKKGQIAAYTKINKELEGVINIMEKRINESMENVES